MVKTKVQTQTVTNTQLGVAVLAAFLAGGLAFASLPMQKKSAQVQKAPVVAVNAVAPAAQAPAEAPITLDRCGTPNGGWQTGKTYRLRTNITPPQGTNVPCFEIDRDRVTLDGENHRITSAANSARTAIRIQNSATNVKIQNLLIENFPENAIITDPNVASLHILNNTFTNNKTAISLTGGNTHEIVGNAILAPGAFQSLQADTYRVGVSLQGVSNVTVSGNRIEGLLLGMDIGNVGNSTFERNTLRNNQVAAYIKRGRQNTFSWNTFDHQSLVAIYLSGTSVGNTVENNTFTMNGGLQYSQAAVAELNINAPLGFADRNRPIDVTKMAVISFACGDECSQNRIDANTFTNSAARPLAIYGSDATTIVNNQINGLNQSVELQNTKNLSFRANTIMNVINESNLVEIFGNATYHMTFENNNLCRNFNHDTVFCGRGVSERDAFSSIQGNSIKTESCLNGKFSNSIICQE